LHGELVADGLLLPPIHADLVDEDDVVALGDCDLLGVGGKLEAADEVALLALVGGLGGELVLLLAVFVEEVDALRGGRLTLSAAPTASFLPLGAQVIADTFFMLSSKGMMLPE
jgi:hypothetical protein